MGVLGGGIGIYTDEVGVTPPTPTWAETLVEGASAGGTSPVMGTTAILLGSSSEQSIGDNGGDLQLTNTSGSVIAAAQSGSDTTTFTIGNNGNTTLIKSGLASASKIVWDVANQTPTVTFTQDTTGTGFTHQFTFPTLTANRVATFQNATGTVAYTTDALGMFAAANDSGTWAVTTYSLGGNTTQAQGANTFAITSTAVNAFSVDGTTFSVDASNNRVGIGTNAPSYPLHITNTTYISAGTMGIGVAPISSYKLRIFSSGASELGTIYAQQLVAASSDCILAQNTAGGTLSYGFRANVGAATTTYGYYMDGGSSAITCYGIRVLPNSTGTNYGIHTRAFGTGTNYGAYFSADTGTANYALVVPASGGNVGFGTTTPSPSALLELSSTTQGFLIMRMTAAQAAAITPVNGLGLYVTDTDATFTSIGFWKYENGAWATW